MSFLKNSEKKSSILLTGGSSGIGLEMCKQLIALGHEVIVVSNDQKSLDHCKPHCSDTLLFDIGEEANRIELAMRVKSKYPQINVLINNAGICYEPPKLKDIKEKDWHKLGDVLRVDMVAPIHLTTLLLPHLATKPEALILNVTDEVAFVPVAAFPIYSAAKAALHSFTLSLRGQLEGSAVQVAEIVPPQVKTGMKARYERGEAADAEEFTRNVLEQVFRGEIEVGYGGSVGVIRASRAEQCQIFEDWNESGTSKTWGKVKEALGVDKMKEAMGMGGDGSGEKYHGHDPQREKLAGMQI
jgi:uncharacterized oxidoreductase